MRWLHFFSSHAEGGGKREKESGGEAMVGEEPHLRRRREGGAAAGGKTSLQLLLTTLQMFVQAKREHRRASSKRERHTMNGGRIDPANGAGINTGTKSTLSPRGRRRRHPLRQSLLIYVALLDCLITQEASLLN